MSHMSRTTNKSGYEIKGAYDSSKMTKATTSKSYLTGAANKANQERLAKEGKWKSVQPYTISSTNNGGGGTNSQGFKSLLDQMKKEMAERNKRYEAILKRQRERQEKLMNDARGAIEGAGKARRQGIEETGIQRQAMGTQNLISKGLGNTTITSAVKRGIDKDTDRNMTYQRSQEAGQVSALYSREAGMQLGEGQFQLGGISGMEGGLEDYIDMLSKLGGGLT